jgi:GTP-binding protein
MTVPRVAIVGRPNVGKSSLLNAIARRRVAIVDETPGVTRDRVTVEITDFDRTFELVDTGGIGVVDRDDLSGQIEGQIEVAVACADVVLFVVDVRAGLQPHDTTVADRLRPLDLPVVLAANKVDAPPLESGAYEFTALGLGDPVLVSAKQRRGLNELLDAVVAYLPAAGPPPEPALKIALLGRRNAGKSTLLNALAREERVIVSEVPGTTRDAVDVKITIGGETIVVIDTAGIRRRKQVSGSVEFYSQRRTLEALRRCDVAFLLLDATRTIARLDKQLAESIVDAAKPCIVLINKWDLARGDAGPEQYEKYVGDHLRNLSFAPIVCISALEGMNRRAAVKVAFSLWKQANVRVGTGALNRAVEAMLQAVPPRRKGTLQPKVYFATQVEVAPPTFVFFVNYPEAFPPDYRRYLANRLRETFDFPEVPVRLFLRQRESRHD